MLDHELKKLPSDSRALIPGYQYYMNPQARALVKELFGLIVPAVATCIDNQREARHVEIITMDENRKVLLHEKQFHPAQDPIFKCWLSLNNQPRFTLDCAKVAEMRKNAEPGDLVREQEEVDEILGRTEKPAKTRTPKAKKETERIEVDLSIFGL